MPQLSTLQYVADLVLERVFAEANENSDLASAIEHAYPFGESKLGRRVWLDAVIRHSAGFRIDFEEVSRRERLDVGFSALLEATFDDDNTPQG